MAPKKQAQKDMFADAKAPKGKGKVKAKAQPSNQMPEPEAFSAASVGKAQQVDFVNTFKRERGSDSEDLKLAKKEVLEFYEGLALRDPKKREVVSKWLNDKTMSWKNEFIRVSETEDSATRSKAQRIPHNL